MLEKAARQSSIKQLDTAGGGGVKDSGCTCDDQRVELDWIEKEGQRTSRN